jgi:hypothetical protein
VRIDISILVDYAVSDSARDNIDDVIDYNVMRDALVAIRPDFSRIACCRVVEVLAAYPGVRSASVYMKDDRGRNHYARSSPEASFSGPEVTPHIAE